MKHKSPPQSRVRSAASGALDNGGLLRFPENNQAAPSALRRFRRLKLWGCFPCLSS